MVGSEADAVDFDCGVEVYCLYSVQRGGKIFGIVQLIFGINGTKCEKTTADGAYETLMKSERRER